jgi:hypothetical protein
MYQIDSGFNKAVYSGNFLKTLIPKINRKAADPKLAEEVRVNYKLHALQLDALFLRVTQSFA